MAYQEIRTGQIANDGSGDTLRSGAQKINQNFTELYNSLSYSLPVASLTELGGVKVGGRLSINNGVLSADDQQYTLPIAGTSSGVLGGVKVDGTTISITDGVITATYSYSLPIAEVSASGQLGGVKVDGSTITITDGVITAPYTYTLPTATNFTLGGVRVDGSTITVTDGEISAVPTAVVVNRTTVTVTSGSLAAGATGTFDIIGFKSYLLFKIQTSAAAWVTLYTDAASRTADLSRLQTVDPLPGSGVIAEVITTGADIIVISPGTVGFNNEVVPTTNIPIKIVNKGALPAAITVTLTLLKIED
jgi:hypothetical protein